MLAFGGCVVGSIATGVSLGHSHPSFMNKIDGKLTTYLQGDDLLLKKVSIVALQALMGAAAVALHLGIIQVGMPLFAASLLQGSLFTLFLAIDTQIHSTYEPEPLREDRKTFMVLAGTVALWAFTRHLGTPFTGAFTICSFLRNFGDLTRRA